MFIGRESELADLKTLFSTKKSAIAVVYGRRRIGKSSLIAQASLGCRFFCFEGLENQATTAQRQIFLEQLQSYGLSFPAQTTKPTWYQLLLRLVELCDPQETTVILLDELQWLANYRSELVSTLKLVWDRNLSQYPNLKLVLCGSVASFMIRKVIKSKALYGRCDLSIELREFKIRETLKMFPEKSFEEVLLAQLLVGGVPKYLSLLKEKDSILLSLAFHSRGKNAYFSNEYEKIFVSHFGSNSHYERIVRLLNGKKFGLGRQEIVDRLSLANSGQLTELLENLESAGMVKSFTPFHKKVNSHAKRFVLVDQFLRFYLSFLEPLRQSGELERIDFVNQVFHTPEMSSWLGTSFEIFCLNYVQEIARSLGFSAVRYDAGPFFGSDLSSKVQLDLVFRRSDKVFTVCELKYRTESLGVEVAQQLDAAILKVAILEGKTIQKVLISAGPVSKKLSSGLYFSRILSAEEIGME